MANLLPPAPPAQRSDDFQSPEWQGWFRQLRNVSASVSVGLQMPTNTFTVSGSPVLNNGTLGVTYKSQSARTFLAAPAVGAGTPTFRSIVASDLPADLSSANVLTWISF